jgi:2-iminobutanoate/2-iminopropanoate deaminase
MSTTEPSRVLTTGAPAPIGPYSQAVRWERMVFCSGQIPLDAASGEVVGRDAAEQAHQVLRNLGAVLNAAGADFADVVKVTIFLVDMADFARVNDVYAGYFSGAVAPARSTVAVAHLPRDVRVEVDAIAVLRS